MKYFLLKTHPAYTIAPDIINSFLTFHPRYRNPGESYQLPDRYLLEIQPNADTVFTDIISSPYLLVSQLVKAVIRLYHPKMIFKEIVLVEAKNDLAEVYYMPILPLVNCLHASSQCNIDCSVIKHGVLDKSMLNDQKIFRIGDAYSANGPYYVVHLDLAESILRRGARGIELKPLDIYPKEEIYEMKGWLS